MLWRGDSEQVKTSVVEFEHLVEVEAEAFWGVYCHNQSIVAIVCLSVYVELRSDIVKLILTYDLCDICERFELLLVLVFDDIAERREYAARKDV